MTSTKSCTCRKLGQLRVEAYPGSPDPAEGRYRRSGRLSVVRQNLARPVAVFAERVHVSHNVTQDKVAVTRELCAARWADEAQERERAHGLSTQMSGQPRLKRVLKHGKIANATIGRDSPKSEDQTPRERILVVEDNAALARTLASKICQFGGKGVAVGTVREALSKLAEPAGWAGVILDLCLPDGRGVRVLESLREKAAGKPDLPVLLLTGNPDHPAIDAAYALRAQILEKPATSAQLEQFFRVVRQNAPGRSHVEPRAGSLSPDRSARPWRPEEGLDHPKGKVGLTARAQWSSVPSESRCFRVDASSENWLARTLSAVETVAAKHTLSPIEREILAAALLGQDRRSIIDARHVSPNTLKTQVRRLLLKTGYFTLDDLRDAVLRSLSDP
jgi:DNA-binding NarL/FixJ family response regulator